MTRTLRAAGLIALMALGACGARQNDRMLLLEPAARAAFLVRAAQFGGQGHLPAGDAAAGDAVADGLLVAVAGGGVQDAIARVQGAGDRGCRVGQPVGAESDGGRFDSIGYMSHTPSVPFAPDLVAFDLDDTLAPSKTPAPPEVATALVDLLRVVPVCVISGGQWQQFETQLLPALDLADAQAERLHLMPTCGTQYRRFSGGKWRPVYARLLSDADRRAATAAVERTAREQGVWAEQTWGPAIEDRGSQITFSALGQRAPLAEKVAWDPSGAKKNRLRAALAEQLPGLQVRSGGSTSVDITERGVDKAYGMRELERATGIALSDMIFVGDRLDEDGNDYPVKQLGVATIAVPGWEGTAAVIRAITDVCTEREKLSDATLRP